MVARLALVALALLAGCTYNTYETNGGGHSDDDSADAPKKKKAADEGTTEDGTTAAANANANAAPVPGSGPKRVIAYFTSWSIYDRNYQVADVPASELTHLDYGFANISANGECVLGDEAADTKNMPALAALKAKNPGLKTLLSVGGFTWSTSFPTLAATAEGRERFATSCTAMMTKFGFDGLDIDWEFPQNAADKANYTALLQQLRTTSKAALPSALLTIAAPASAKTAANYDLATIAKTVDWVNLMAYDFHGSWETATGPNAPLASADGLDVKSAVKTYLDGGIPRAQLVLGMPTYGRGFAKTTSASFGGGYTGVPKGTWEDGVFDYKDLAANYVTKLTRTVDPVTKVPSLFDPATGTLISYDDPESLGAKAKYVHDQALGGAMLWELSGDDAQSSLLHAVKNNL